MTTVLVVLGVILAFCFWPFAVILGGVGFWLFGVWGCVVGVLGGLFLQAAT